MPIPPGRTPRARWAAVALVALTVVAALWRLPALGAEDLWFDEVFTAVLAAQDLGEVLRRALGDQTNPPGFYLLLSGWARIGSHDPSWLRTLPALAYLATIPAIAWSARALGMRHGAALLGALLAATAPLAVAMGSEVRAYAVTAVVSAVLLGVGAQVAMAERRPGPWTLLALAVLNIVAVSLHYFGALVIASSIVGTAWIARDRLRLALATALPAATLLALWIVAVIVGSAGGTIGVNARWIPTSSGGALATFAANVVGGLSTTWGPLVVLAALTTAIAWAMRRARSSEPSAASLRARWLLAAVLVPLLLVPIIGLATGQPIWVARYLIIVLPPLWLLLADAVTDGPPRLRTVAIVATVGWAAFAAPIAELARPKKTPWSLMVRALGGSGPARVCVNEPFVGLPLEFYAVTERVPLAVQSLDVCAERRDATLLIGRPGTGASLGSLQRAGAEFGRRRDLGTRLPEVVAWPIVRWAPR